MTKQPVVKPDVTIDCGEGSNAYKVILGAGNLKVFERAREKLGATDKKGEELVAAILAVMAPGDIQQVSRFKAGKRNDGANGEPAVQSFDRRGRIFHVGHYKDDKMNDGADGTAAVQYFNLKGTLSRAFRYANDLRNDGAKGEPAYQSFDDQGKLVRIEYYKAGKSNDGAKGAPALQVFLGGRLNAAYSYKDGKKVKRLSAAEIAAYIAKAKKPAAKKAPAPKGPTL